MISDMRTRFKKNGFQVVIWIVLLSMVGVASLPDLLKRMWGEPTDWSISVNGNKASALRFSQKFEQQQQMINMFRKQFGPQADMLLASYGLNDPKEFIFKGLVQELLLGKVAKDLKLQVDSDYIHQEVIKQLPPEMISSGNINMELISSRLNYPSVKAFEKEFETNIKNSLVVDFAKAAVYVPEFMVKNEYNKDDVKKKYSVLVFSDSKYLSDAQKTQLTEEEVKSYYNKNKKKYMTQEKREGLVWEFSPENYKINVTDKEIENHYNKNKKSFIDKPVQIQVKRILFKVDDPKNMASIRQRAQNVLSEVTKDKSKFSELIKKYSQDLDSAKNKDLIEFSKGQKDPEFERAAFELTANDDISDLVQTKDGLEIIQRIGKKPATFKKLEDVKAQIKETIEKERFKKLFDLDAKQFVRKVNSLNEEDKKAELVKNFIQLKKGSEKKIASMVSNPSMNSQKLFSIRNEHGFIYYVQGEKGYIVELTKLDKSYLPELDAIKKSVEGDIYKEKAANNLKSDLDKAKKSKSKSFEELKKLFDAKLVNTNWISKQDNPDAAMLQKEGINPVELFKLEKEGSVSSYFANNNGYLIKVDNVEPFNMQKFDEGKKAIEDSLEKQNIADLEAGFIASLQKNAKIVINDKMQNQQQTKFPR